jgi:HEPN domain-containing protein
MSDELVAEWVVKAEEDWVALGHLRTRALADVPNALTFHAEQCGEKYLKALIQREGSEPPRIHHLPALLDLLIARHPDLEALRAACEGLSPYAVHFRYPGGSATPEDATEAIAWTELIRAAIRAKLTPTGAK